MSHDPPSSQVAPSDPPPRAGIGLLAPGALQALAERASVGIFLAQGLRFLYVNPALCEMTGYPREALLAVEDAVGTLFAPQDQGRIRAYGEGRVRGEPVPSVYEACIVRADGTPLQVEISVSVLEADGTVLSQGTVHDVSERTGMARALRALLDASTESAALLDPQGRVLAANAVFARRLGCPLEELLGQAVWPHFPQEVRAGRRAALGEVVRAGQAVRFVDTPQGYTFDTQICPIPDASGAVTRVAVFARDITQQRAAEQASQDARQALLRRNRDLSILNRVATTLVRSLGLEAALGEALEHVIDREGIDAAALLLPEGTRGAPLLLTRGADAGAPLFADLLGGLPDEPCFLDYAGDARAELAATGNVILFHEPEEMPPPLAAALERAGFGHVACMPVPIGSDVGGALVLLAYDRLHVSEGTLRILSAIVAQVGWAVENARLAALTSEIQVREEVSALQARFLADVSHEFRTPLGLIRSASQSLRSSEVHFEAEVRDELLRIVEAETRRLETLVEDLLLAARAGERPLELHCRPVDLVGLARAAVARIAALQAAAPLFAAPLSAAPLSPAPLSTAPLSAAPDPPASPSAGDPRARPGAPPSHQFAVLAAGEPVVAWADASALGRVFGNLLSNAVKYSPHGGTITVEVTGQDGEAVVCVRDEGIGIPPEHLGRVFDRFYRVPNDLAARQGGIGLGLPVCKALVEAHGGRIWVDSRPGQGSTFAFTVPLADEAHLAKVHAHADAPPSPG